MKIVPSKDEWDIAPIGDLQFDLATGKGYVLWVDGIKNIWLEAHFSTPLFLNNLVTQEIGK